MAAGQIRGSINCQNQSHRFPTRSCSGNPLVITLGESALELFLEGKCSRLDHQRTIRGLIGEQIV